MSDMISQAEIDALLGGFSLNDTAPSTANVVEDKLTAEQKDILGEIGNISMGSAATTLFTLLSQKVMITTPRVRKVSWSTLAEGYDRPCVGVRVDYKEGIRGSNILILKEHDVKIITNLMMGGDGTNVTGELNEIDLSAIGEAMNQMVGSSSTSLSSMIKKKIDILPPHAFVIDFNNEDFFDNIGFGQEGVVCISFRMEIGTLIDSEIMQILSEEFALEMVNSMISETSSFVVPSTVAPPPKQAEVAVAEYASGQNQAMPTTPAPTMPAPQQPAYQDPLTMYGTPQQPYPQAAPQYPMPQQPYPQQPYQDPMMQQYYMQQMQMQQQMQQQMEMIQHLMQQTQQQQYQMPMQPGANTTTAKPTTPIQNINAQPAQFQSFDMTSVLQQKENMGIIMDVPLDVTVELGRTQKLIREILEFAPGTIVELDKLSAEPIDVYVNGKFVAKGEVVVIDENFAIRISDVVSVENRI